MNKLGLSNCHINLDDPAPPIMSELDKALAMVRWWHKWLPGVRESIIKEKCSSMWSTTDGILGALLLGLEDIDPEKLTKELGK